MSVMQEIQQAFENMKPIDVAPEQSALQKALPALQAAVALPEAPDASPLCFVRPEDGNSYEVSGLTDDIRKKFSGYLVSQDLQNVRQAPLSEVEKNAQIREVLDRRLSDAYSVPGQTFHLAVRNPTHLLQLMRLLFSPALLQVSKTFFDALIEENRELILDHIISEIKKL